MSDGTTNEEILRRWKGQLERDLSDAVAERARIDQRIERLKDGIETFDRLSKDPSPPSQEGTT